MAVPLIQQWRVGTYILNKKIRGIEKYPLVLMLEPLFRCNLACPGCGKIDYEEKIIGKEYTKEQFLEAVPNARTVPQIFIDDKYVGGYNELLDFLESDTN